MRPLVDVVCLHCGKEFKREKNRVQAAIKNNWKIYCSSECASKDQQTGEVYRCAECGKEVIRTPGSFKKTKNVFCSQSCGGKYNNREYPKKVKNTPVKCGACGNEFLRSAQEIERDKKLNRIPACSKTCATYIRNTKNPKPKKEKQSRGSRKKVVAPPKLCKTCNKPIPADRVYCKACYKADNEKILAYTIGQIRELYKDKSSMAVAAKIRGYGQTIYKNSDKPKYCIHCGYSKFYEICHIIAVKDFPDTATMAEVHAIDNLIALCPNCHWEYDHGMLSIEQIKSAA